MSKIENIYTIYIRTTAERLWDAITKPEFSSKYWCARNSFRLEKGIEMGTCG